MKRFEKGDIVVSIQGRDLGVHYLVCETLSDNYYLLTNGDNKKFENPKRKIAKHIDKIGQTHDNIKMKLNCGLKVFDSEVYSAIKKFKEDSIKGNDEVIR